jgi:GT2 family glycosyltransferase
MKNQITIIIVTYQTSKEILLRCLNSIDKKIKIIIIENSKKFKDQVIFLKKFRNLKIICTGSNLGYGKGNNLGLGKVKTKYALILNPDSLCEKNFFTNLKGNLKKIKDFHLIGCTYKNSKNSYPAGYFDNEQNKNFENNFRKNKLATLTKVDWIRGFSIILNMKKFKRNHIFDKNYFLYLEEIDLCKSIKKKSGNVYFAKNLKVNHLGFKGSVGASNYEKQNADNLRNWHYMWSSFYFYKKNYNYFFALKKMFGKFLRAFIKTIFFSLTFQKDKRNKYLYRFLGILHSMIGFKSHFRVNKFY